MKILKFQTFSEKESLLKDFNPSEEAWIVSDLQSKWEIQNLLLERESVLEEESVLRASEFWTRLLFRVQPEWSVVSKELFEQWLWNWSRKNPLPWLKANESASLIHQHLELFAPIFIEDGSSALLSEWFENNLDSVIKWRHLFELCERIWRDLQSERIISPVLVPAVLFNELNLSDTSKWSWNRNLYLDLGLKPKSIEKALAAILGRHLEVRWLHSDVNINEIELIGDLKRLPTQLGEVKEAVASVRFFLEQGVPAREIAVLAPDIEMFWPSLHHFLKIEGVRCNKPVIQRLIEDPGIRKWISILRVSLNKFTSRDLESYFFQRADDLSLNFEEFRYYFEKLKRPEDIMRWSGWASDTEPLAHPLSLDDFLSWAIEKWPRSFSSEPLERAWKNLSKDYSPKLKLHLSDWIYYLESKLSKAECVVEDADLDGIQLLSFSSAEWTKARHTVFIGMNESDLSASSSLLVSKFECEKIKQDLGFELDLSSDSAAELYLAWLTKKSFSKTLFLTSGVTFTGEETSPSKHWLKSAFHYGSDFVKRISSPSPIRFDELARLVSNETVDFIPVPFQEISLSATSIKSFKECPFTFFAQKGLRLVDQPVLDFDLDPMSKGRLFHAVAEEIIKDLPQFESNTGKIEELIEDQKKKHAIEIGELRIWPAMKQEIKDMALSLIQMEIELRATFPHTRTLASEVDFEFYFDPVLKEVSAEPGSKTVRITGRIDRIDGGANEALTVVDYKLSSTRLLGWGNWVKEGDLQMAIYTIAIEGKFTKDKSLKMIKSPQVDAAYYLVPKTKERNKGFFLKNSESGLFVHPSSRSQSWITSEKKSEMFVTAKEVLSEVIIQIRNGEVAPNPKKEDICEPCRWRILCRAQRLT